VIFYDPRAKSAGQPASGGKDVTDGVSVGVLDNASDAVARGQYIQTVTRAIQIVGPEYDFVSGTPLLRLTGTLTPSAARQYATAFRLVVGAPLVTPLRPIRDCSPSLTARKLLFRPSPGHEDRRYAGRSCPSGSCI
jgi:hypothetical protein